MREEVALFEWLSYNQFKTTDLCCVNYFSKCGICVLPYQSLHKVAGTYFQLFRYFFVSCLNMQINLLWDGKNMQVHAGGKCYYWYFQEILLRFFQLWRYMLYSLSLPPDSDVAVSFAKHSTRLCVPSGITHDIRVHALKKDVVLPSATEPKMWKQLVGFFGGERKKIKKN